MECEFCIIEDGEKICQNKITMADGVLDYTCDNCCINEGQN